MRTIIAYEKMREDCKKVAGELWDELVSFYKGIVNNKNNDAILFVTRRCYVMYVIIALCEGWDFDKRVLTDMGIYANKEKLRSANRIVLVDDIAMRGFSINKAANNVFELIEDSDKVDVKLFALCNDVPQKMRILSNNSVLQREKTLTYSDATNLSLKMVQIIEYSGVPYVTFVYPTIYKDCEQHTGLSRRNDSLLKYKWHMDCIEHDISSNILGKVGYYACVRRYKSPREYEQSLVEELPFIFLKDLKIEYASMYYKAFTEATKIIGEWISNEVEKCLKEAFDDNGKSYQYLRCLESLLFSRMIGYDLESSNMVDDKLAYYILAGSFDEDIIQGLQYRLDKKSISSFFDVFEDNLNLYVEDIEKIFSSQCELDNEYVKSILDNEDWESFDNPFEAQKDMFWKIKIQNKGYKGEEPAVACWPLLQRLEKYKNKWSEKSYSSMITCWDTGIATYKYKIGNKCMYSCCGAGEMSALKLQVVFGEALGQYYSDSSKREKKHTQEELWNYITNGIDDKYNLHNDFVEWYEKNNGNMYQYAIFK